MKKIITHIKYANKEKTKIEITIDDKKVVVTTDKERRAHTPLVLEYLKNNGVMEAFETEKEEDERIKAERYARLEQIFINKFKALEVFAIDKPNMRDPQAIASQKILYDEMYRNAKENLYDAETSLAIITAHEHVSVVLADLVLMLNTIKSILDYKITMDDESVDAMLDYADDLSFTREEMSVEIIDDIKSTFGLGGEE